MSESDQLISLAKQVSKYCVGMEGNVSAKTNTGLLIKASGARLNNLNTNNLVEFDFKGNQISNMDRKGSMELSFHMYLLEFNDINFVSHTHPTNTLKVICSVNSTIFANKRFFPDQVIFNGKKSCLVPYAKPGNDLTHAIKINVEYFIAKEGYFPKLILLENHGIITCGKTIDECIISSEICEKSAEIYSGFNIDNLFYLSDKQVDDLINDDNEKYRESLIK